MLGILILSTSYNLKLKLDDIQSADQKFSFPDRIDMLLDAYLFWSLILPGQRSLERDIILQSTKLGWLVGGCIPNLIFRHNWQSSGSWKNAPKNLCALQKKSCAKSITISTPNVTDGRFIVTILFKDDFGKPGDSREQAVRRFMSLETLVGKQQLDFCVSKPR